MKVSVIIPAYNCSAFLPSMIESIFHSGLSVFEILIVNDGSTDNTRDVTLKIVEQYETVRVINQPNCGVSAARNRGIREAKGDYIYFVDADDLLIPGSLIDVNEMLENEQPDMLLFGMTFDFYKRGIVYRSDEKCYPKRGLLAPSEWSREYETLFAENMFSPVWNKIISRNLILENQLSFREDMIEMEDYLFSAQCLLHCNQIYVLNRVVYRYRQTEDEKGTFNRLWRIESLSGYMRPFYEVAEALEARFSKTSSNCNAIRVSDQIYAMLFHEQLRFATQEQIKLAAQDMLSSEYSGVIARIDTKLYQNLKNQCYSRVWRERALKRVHHQVAEQVKYGRSLRNLE